MRLTIAERIWSGVLCASCLTVLLVASWLSVGQSPDGEFTRSIGLHDCGFYAATGRPCATCGYTRSFAHVSSGRVAEAATLQPVGTIMAFVAACVAWIAGVSAATGSRIGPAAARAIGMKGVWTAIALIAAGWCYTLITWGPPGAAG